MDTGADLHKATDGLKLFEDLIEHRITFDEFLEKFRELPKADQDRLLATKPNPLQYRTLKTNASVATRLSPK